MNRAAQPDAKWKLVAGRPCLDFVNTVGGRVSPTGRSSSRIDFADRITRDDLPDYDSLVRWSAFASLVGGSESERLRDLARRSPPGAARVLRRAVRLREAIYRIAKAMVEGSAPPAADVKVLDREVREARRRQRLVARKGRLESEWIAGRTRLDRMLWPVALSAAALLGSREVSRLKQCGGTRCGWLFLDTTRNHSRRWCDMADCGNVAKVHRFRQRRRRVPAS